MFVVDSCVWIDHFAARQSRETALLEKAVYERSPVFTCGPVIQEVMQGVRRPGDADLLWRSLMKFTFLEVTRWTFLKAAAVHRRLRSKGYTIQSYDTAIAALCIEQGLPLLTRDRGDFEPVARHTGLTLA
jgi:predicted nucleic acid-binding protein